MRKALIPALVILVIATGHAYAIEAQKTKLSEPFFVEYAEECYLQYYYYIPCPTQSWFWRFTEWAHDDVIGQYFVIGDNSMGIYDPCDPAQCHTLDKFRVLDFAGYGTIYPGLFTVQFDIWCADGDGCPVGDALWSSGPFETQKNWGFVEIDPPLAITECCIYTEPYTHPRILITARHIGAGDEQAYPGWGSDNISAPLEEPCAMHDIGCLPALYPRPTSSHYPTIHSGYYGVGFLYCPPLWFLDGADTLTGPLVYGYVEWAWRLYLICEGPHATEPASWGNIKSMYK